MKKTNEFTDRAGRTVKVYETVQNITRTIVVEFRDGEVWELSTKDEDTTILTVQDVNAIFGLGGDEEG